MKEKRDDREKRIDRYVKDYSVRTLAEMLVDLEDVAEPYLARRAARMVKRIKAQGERMKQRVRRVAR